MRIVRGNIPDALDFSAHLVSQKILASADSLANSEKLLASFAQYYEYRYIAEYEKSLIVLIEIGMLLFGKPGHDIQYWEQLHLIAGEIVLKPATIDEINKSISLKWF